MRGHPTQLEEKLVSEVLLGLPLNHSLPHPSRLLLQSRSLSSTISNAGWYLSNPVLIRIRMRFPAGYKVNLASCFLRALPCGSRVSPRLDFFLQEEARPLLPLLLVPTLGLLITEEN